MMRLKKLHIESPVTGVKVDRGRQRLSAQTTATLTNNANFLKTQPALGGDKFESHGCPASVQLTGRFQSKNPCRTCPTSAVGHLASYRRSAIDIQVRARSSARDIAKRVGAGSHARAGDVCDSIKARLRLLEAGLMSSCKIWNQSPDVPSNIVRQTLALPGSGSSREKNAGVSRSNASGSELIWRRKGNTEWQG